MSAIASLYILPELSIAAWEGASPTSYDAIRRGSAREVATYSWSGWVIASLLPILAEKYEIRLFTDAAVLAGHLTTISNAFHAICEATAKDALLAQLDSTHFDAGELRVAFEEFNATTFEQAGEMMLDGIAFLRSGLRSMTANDFLLLVIA